MSNEAVRNDTPHITNAIRTRRKHIGALTVENMKASIGFQHTALVDI